ncbi:MAG TPA: TonB-dependent receptor, partial [candidate division Zixibacteria bacterium]|nr:TonB-dependent receptor [candidate division Zixibacteria bacterium]
ELYLNRYGYDSLGNESDNEGYKNSTKKPVFLGLYIQDRFDWRGLVVNAGLRYDYFDYKALRIKNLNNPFDPDTLNAADKILDESDLEASKKYSRFSPRLGISFPISDVTQMHINFGKFIQRPDLQNLYVGYDYFEARNGAGFFSVFSSPNLEPEKSTQYEVGITHQLGDFTSFDITAYYKDVQDLTSGAEISPAIPVTYNVFSNVDYGTIKGVDFGFTMRRNKNISASLKYSLSYASGTGSYAGTNRNILWKNASGIPKTTSPLVYDQRHSIIGNVHISSGKGEGPEIGGFKPFENISFNTLFQLASGTPYTPTKPYDAVTAISVKQEPIGGVNSANLPWQATVDVKIEKSFTVSDKYKIVPYFWIRNLLDKENIVAVYEGTGEANTTGFLNTTAGEQNITADGQDYLDRYSLLENNPKNYGTPRMIYFGLRVSF